MSQRSPTRCFRVCNGGSALDPEIVGVLLGRRRKGTRFVLAPREREVLGLMAEGRTNSAMADALAVSVRAVERHVTSIFSKLDLAPAGEDHRRVLAVLAFLRLPSRVAFPAVEALPPDPTTPSGWARDVVQPPWVPRRATVGGHDDDRVALGHEQHRRPGAAAAPRSKGAYRFMSTHSGARRDESARPPARSS